MKITIHREIIGLERGDIIKIDGTHFEVEEIQ